MPHLRVRHVFPAFRKLKAFSPLVGIFGHRQVGKTTFLEMHSKKYSTFDDDETRRSAEVAPRKFLEKLGGDESAIDEAQLVPPIFPALKLWVQKCKRPGQFLLSGSVRFTSRKAIKESLTGRIATVELFPFTLAEIRKDALPDFLPRLLVANQPTARQIPAREHLSRLAAYRSYLELGGLPGVCFIREAQTRERFLQDILRTVLDRDLRLVYKTSLPFSDLRAVCTSLAKLGLAPIELSALHRKTHLAPGTLRHLLDAFESIYLIRRLPIEGGGRRSSIVFLEDQLEQNHLAMGELDEESKQVGLAYRNARAQFEYRLGATPTFFHYLTRAGSCVPLGIRTPEGTLGILPLRSARDINRSTMGSVSSFLKTYNRSKVLITVEDESESEIINDRILVAPVTHVY